MGHVSGVFNRKQERPGSQRKKRCQKTPGQWNGATGALQHGEESSKGSVTPLPSDAMGLVWCHVGLGLGEALPRVKEEA